MIGGFRSVLGVFVFQGSLLLNFCVRSHVIESAVSFSLALTWAPGSKFFYLLYTKTQGPRSKFSSGGAKEECVKENFFRAGGGACLWISIQFL